MSDAVPIVDLDSLDRADWLAARRRGIGGSDAAAICGQDRWRSPFEVWLDKTAAPGLHDEDNEAMEWGRRLEPIVRAAAAERTGLTIKPVTAMLAHPEREWQIANIDGLARQLPGEPGVYEGKTAGLWSASEWADDQVPAAYLLQGQHYLAVTGLAWLLYAVLIGGQRLELRWVDRDDELIGHLTALEAEFWQRVIDRTPPDPDGSKACTELLARLYDVKAGTVFVVDHVDAVEDLLVERVDAKKALAAASDTADAAENRLKVLIGEHEIAQAPDGRVLFTWKQVKQARVDVKALQEERPDLVDSFTYTSTHRRFHVPKRKDQ